MALLGLWGPSGQWVKGSGANGVKGRIKGQYPMVSFGANGANAAVSNGAKRSNGAISNRLGTIQLAMHYPIGQHGANHAKGIAFNRSKNAHKHLVATR